MRVAIPRINTSIGIIDGQVYDYSGCLSIWDNIPLKLVVTGLPTDIIVSFFIQCRSSLESSYVANLEPVNGIEIDLASHFYPLLPAYKDRIARYAAELVLTHRANLTADLKTQKLRIPIMNLASRNNINRIANADTDFRDKLGRRAPLAHTLDDEFFINSQYYDRTYDMDVIYQNGYTDVMNYSQGGITKIREK